MPRKLLDEHLLREKTVRSRVQGANALGLESCLRRRVRRKIDGFHTCSYFFIGFFMVSGWLLHVLVRFCWIWKLFLALFSCEVKDLSPFGLRVLGRRLAGSS